MSALAKAPDHPELLKALDEYRQRLNVTSLWNRDPDLVGKMVDTLKTGETLGMVIDQKPPSRRGYRVTFLGEPTMMVGGPVKMWRNTHAVVFGVYCLRVKPFHYQVWCQQLAEPAEPEAMTNKELAQSLSDSMAAAIAKSPSQWAWNYKRWPDQPKKAPS